MLAVEPESFLFRIAQRFLRQAAGRDRPALFGQNRESEKPSSDRHTVKLDESGDSLRLCNSAESEMGRPRLQSSA